MQEQRKEKLFPLFLCNWLSVVMYYSKTYISFIMATGTNAIATEQEAYEKGNSYIKRMYYDSTPPVNKKSVIKSRLKYFGCKINPSISNAYKSNQCVKYSDIIYDGGQTLDDSWIWYYQITPSMIYTWENAIVSVGESNWTTFQNNVSTLACLGSYLVKGYYDTLSYAPFSNVHSNQAPFNLNLGNMDGGLRLFKAAVGSTDTGIFIGGHGGYANEDGKFFTNFIEVDSSIGYTKSEHQINIRYSDGQMDDNWDLSGQLLFIFRFCLNRINAGNGWGTEYTSIGIAVNDMKVSKMTYAEYNTQLQQGRITDYCSYPLGETSSAFPISPSE